MNEDKKSIIVLILAYAVLVGIIIIKNGFNLFIISLVTILTLAAALFRKYIFEHWNDKPYLKFTIGLLVLYIIRLIIRKI